MQRIVRRVLFVSGLACLAWITLGRKDQSTPISPELQERLVQNVDWATDVAHSLLEDRLAELKRRIVDRHEQCDAFADQMLRWSAKATLVKEGVGLGAKGSHEQYVRRAFAAQIITTNELRQIVVQTTEGFQRDLLATQNELLVRMKHDIQDMPGGSRPSETLSDSIVESLESVIVAQPSASISASQHEVIAFLASTVLAEALTPIAIEVLTSAGLLTAGAVSAPETFGIGLGVAVLVDVAYSKITDPAGKLSTKLQSQLVTLADSIIEGQPNQSGLREQLEQLLQQQVSTNQVLLSVIRKR